HFDLRKVAEIGVASARSMGRCNNDLLFLSLDGMVYVLSPDKPLPLALPIEPLLQAIDGVYLQNATAAYVGQRCVLAVPSAAGRTARRRPSGSAWRAASPWPTRPNP